MPEFCNPFSGLKNDRNVTHEELVRAIRFMIAAEYEAVQLYQQLAESTDNRLAQEVLNDIADEEKEHAGIISPLPTNSGLRWKMGFYVFPLFICKFLECHPNLLKYGSWWYK